MATVKFHGDLKRFAPKDGALVLCAESFQELMSGLLTQIVGLKQHLRQGYYKVRIGRNQYLNEAQLKSNTLVALDDDCTVHFTPVVAGAGKNMNIANIVIGVVLIAASWYAGGAAGWSYLGAQGFAGATMAFTIGASMVVSGVMGLLTRPPDMNNKLGDSEKQQSTSFSNLRNLTPQGRPIPLLYGKMMTSLILISQGVESYDEITEEERQRLEAERKKQEAETQLSVEKTQEKQRIRKERAESARDAREERDRNKREKRAKRERREKQTRDLIDKVM